MTTVTLFDSLQPFSGEFDRRNPHDFKFKSGDVVAYIHATNVGTPKASYQFKKIKILGRGYGRQNIPRYHIETLEKISVKGGKINSTRIFEDQVTPEAQRVDKHSFPVENWDEEIRRKINRTKLKQK